MRAVRRPIDEQQQTSDRFDIGPAWESCLACSGKRPLNQNCSRRPGASTKHEQQQLLDPDRPTTIGSADPLRRAQRIRRFEDQLRRVPISDSFVFSLEGPWGSGKTSVLDTVEADLSEQETIVLRFNPLAVFLGQ